MRDRWTLEDMPDLSGRAAIVTGASSGMGLETSRELARRGAVVVLACRDARRGEAAIESVRSGIPDARVSVQALDLASLASVGRFAAAFRDRHDRLDLLILNAGVLLAPHDRTEDGFELHFGINHLGHFALTGLLIDRLLGTSGSRVVTVSSLAHARGRIDFAAAIDGTAERYAAARAYARSKLANLLFSYELQRRLRGTAVISVAAHPGGAATSLGRRMTDRPGYRLFLPLLEWLSQSAAQGARPILRAATDPNAAGGEYYGPAGRLGMRGHPVTVPSSSCSHDLGAAARLWELSETLTGVRFLSAGEALT